MRVLGCTGCRVALGSLILAVGVAASAADQIQARDRDQDRTQAHIEDQDRVRLSAPIVRPPVMRPPVVLPPIGERPDPRQRREEIIAAIRERAQACREEGENPGEGESTMARVRAMFRNLFRWQKTP